MKIFFPCLVYFICVATAEERVPESFTGAVTLFTGEVYTKIHKIIASNFLVSPFSAETILALTLFGAVGETAEELRRALHLPNYPTEIKEVVNSLLLKLKNNHSYTLRTANKIYTREDFQIKADFKSVAVDAFLAEIEPVNFSKSSETADIINKWVEEQTDNKIKHLINVDSLNANIRAILVNALYFKADWLKQFNLRLTEKRKFYRTSNDAVDVDTLYIRHRKFQYHNCSHLHAQFLKLQFKNNASMNIMLPHEKEGLSFLEQNIEDVLKPHENLKEEYLNVALPKFKFETTVNFKKILNDLGVFKIFGTEADLSGIAGTKGDLYVDEVTQKTVIDVNEVGVEAAAATQPGILALSAPLNAQKSFIAEHPFVFYIEVEGFIIFVGRVIDPLLH